MKRPRCVQLTARSPSGEVVPIRVHTRGGKKLSKKDEEAIRAIAEAAMKRQDEEDNDGNEE